MDLKTRAKKLKIDVPAIFIALSKKETPILAKVLALITIIYALSPIDLIPDFIPVLGYLDDILLLPFFIALTIKLIPDEVFTQCIEEAKTLTTRDLKRWYFALPILLFWIITLYYLYIIIVNYIN
ncbi:YkvA family protein [Macrococcus sp. EM39E]|uniref:YkvA family protein n=1 Tax=Macrococcus animalis TaxID=3395467 RepID=UPI0039BDAC75